MSDLAICAKGLSKKYQLGALQPRYKTFRESFTRTLWVPFKKIGSLFGRKKLQEERPFLWALKNVSFEVNKGEVLGIIGRNGGGKSTLLKILSRITSPTDGEVKIYGRVGSLLEVGTGFHPELSGRENIYLNGSILGMRKREIDNKFDEIIHFSELEKFIDTALKHYSSGMYMRLAFAVAAHLEPEILMIDEVLSVGDVSFQKKCMRKMGSVAQEGRTIILVSHNMGAIKSLCEHALWIDKGQIQQQGNSGDVISNYLSQFLSEEGAFQTLRNPDGNLEIKQVLIKNCREEITHVFSTGEPLVIEIHYLVHKAIKNPYFWLAIKNHYGNFFAANMLLDGHRPSLLEGEGMIKCTFKTLPLMAQQNYFIELAGRQSDGRTSLIEPTEVALFQVVGSAKEIGLEGESAESLLSTSTPILIPYEWELPGGKKGLVDFTHRGEKNESF